VVAGLTADTLDDDLTPRHIFVWGPKPVDGFTSYEVDLLLDELEQGKRQIVADEDGDPRLL
jgi:hypothetical protein